MKPQVARKCPVCGVGYKADPQRLKFGRQTTCGRRCSYKARASKSSKQRLLRCSTCGNEFSRPPSHIKSKHEGVYCSRECHYLGRTSGATKRICERAYVLVAEYDRQAVAHKIWAARRRNGTDKHSEATRQKLREATVRHLSSHPRTGVHVSKLEDKVAKEFARRGVAFERQVALRGISGRYEAVIDFVIDGIAVEVNGTFWHTDPRVYPNGPVHTIQQQGITRYARKVGILQARGIPLVEIWELDVRKSLENAVSRALEEAGVA